VCSYTSVEILKISERVDIVEVTDAGDLVEEKAICTISDVYISDFGQPGGLGFGEVKVSQAGGLECVYMGRPVVLQHGRNGGLVRFDGQELQLWEAVGRLGWIGGDEDIGNAISTVGEMDMLGTRRKEKDELLEEGRG